MRAKAEQFVGLNRGARMPSSNIWGITSYYNPLRYRRREMNFLRFREALDLPLIVVELSADGTFQIVPDKETIVVRIQSEALLWHKETLLNYAFAHLPGNVRYVAWLDCDILFQNANWVSDAIRVLEKSPVAQLFSDLYDLDHHGKAPELGNPSGRGVVSLISEGADKETIFRPRTGMDVRKTAYGLAWAAHLSVMLKHKMYDAMVIGGGDIAFAAAAYGRSEDVVETLHLSPAHSLDYFSWARKFYETVGGNVGFVEGAVNHLWHGSIEKRAYRKRHEVLNHHAFDPQKDLVRDSGGIWQWAREGSDLQSSVEEYFSSRREDDI